MSIITMIMYNIVNLIPANTQFPNLMFENLTFNQICIKYVHSYQIKNIWRPVRQRGITPINIELYLCYYVF